ncbi:MAG TPA: glycogen debranching protein GlgX [Stenomitos sp.]
MPTLDRLTANTARSYTLEEGHFSPLGATPDADGVNFSLFSQHATAVTLLLFETETATEPFLEIPLDPRAHKTFFFWHVYVRGLTPGVHYAYRVDGPFDLARGHRFDAKKLLIDPYARGLSMALWDRARYMRGDDPLTCGMRSVVVDTSGYDWEGDRPLNLPMRETVIYEMHVGGFTQSPTSGVKHPGTFAGVIEKIPYLKSLGITAVELLPVFAFDPTELDRVDPVTGETLTNYWGYSTVSFFTPHLGYCRSTHGADAIDEFRDMVKALHRAGIEVILDVVFNHTSEGDHWGPTLSFKGLDNSIYYHLEPGHPEHYRNFSGCGNTLNCNHPVVDKFIMECLKFWVTEMHVDGFRFDLGSILTRGEDGRPLPNPPVVWGIELSDEFSRSKIIAEAWDAAGLYQVGYFPGRRWADWNGQYRDDIRRFVRGDRGLIGKVASRIAGSSDIYQPNHRYPINSINFVTCHDGFTLNDLVSYAHKHNLANGEMSRDGTNDNWSANYGTEGYDASLEPLRNRQIKNFLAILMLSQGVPMLYAGDEVRRTQHGNNNAYCHDNELNWFDWTLPAKHADVLRFTRKLIAFRDEHDHFTRHHFLTGERNTRGVPDIEWHGCHLHAPGMDDPASGVLAFTMGGEVHDFHVMLNMEPAALAFEIPQLPGRSWKRLVDTALESPLDFADPGHELLITEPTYLVTDRSIVILQGT